MGHASIQTTLDVYGHIVRDNRQEVATRLEATLLGPLRSTLFVKDGQPETGITPRPN